MSIPIFVARSVWRESEPMGLYIRPTEEAAAVMVASDFAYCALHTSSLPRVVIHRPIRFVENGGNLVASLPDGYQTIFLTAQEQCCVANIQDRLIVNGQFSPIPLLMINGLVRIGVQ